MNLKKIRLPDAAKDALQSLIDKLEAEEGPEIYSDGTVIYDDNYNPVAVRLYGGVDDKLMGKFSRKRPGLSKVNTPGGDILFLREEDKTKIDNFTKKANKYLNGGDSISSDELDQMERLTKQIGYDPFGNWDLLKD